MKVHFFNEKPLKSFSPLTAYAGVLLSPRCIVANFKCFYTILKEFFLLQFLEKFRLIHIPVVHVDHPLDETIPFIPEKVSVYLDFINLWVRPLSMLVKKFGCWRAAAITKRWMVTFRALYKTAGEIYHFRLTTTNRPNYNEKREFRQIHALDPHYMCVPSLHIATVALVFGFYRSLFRENESDFSTQEKNQWETELYNSAVEIAETVLYVKQHSVNCIPAALYLVVANFGTFFSADDARKFISDMFAEPDGFSTEHASLIRQHISRSFETYMTEGAAAQKWFEPVRTFLTEYQP